MQRMEFISSLPLSLHLLSLSTSVPSLGRLPLYLSSSASYSHGVTSIIEGETFKINWFDQEFYFDVVKVSPGNAITLYGNLDLEVDLEVPLSDGKGRVRKTPRKRVGSAALSASSDGSIPSTFLAFSPALVSRACLQKV